MIFKDPLILIFIPLILAAVFVTRKQQRWAALRFPSHEIVENLHRTLKFRLSWLPGALSVLALLLLVVALAGPRSLLADMKYESEGIDIILAIDASGSMAAEDFTLKGRRYNRLEVVKTVVSDFIDGRSADRIGIVVFAGLAYTVSPLTTDYSWLKTNLERIALNMMEDGTAIGSAITASLSRLEKTDAKSKVVILLTDGVNNRGKVDPLTAAKAAQSLGIKIYTIGAGINGMAPYPVQDIWGRRGYQNVPVEIDEQTLTLVAQNTGGKYFRATDTDSLREIYREIDRLEKTKIQEQGYREYQELFGYFVLAGLGALLLAFILENTYYFRLP